MQSENVSIARAIVHRVGNMAQGQRLVLSENTLTLNDELVRQLMAKYVLQHFNEQEQYRFTHHSSLGLNEIYAYARHIFSNPDDFVAQSAHIAQQLYQVSTHSRIKAGELYVIHLQGLQLEHEKVDAIALVKSETKNTFLKLLQHGKSLEVIAEEGLNLHKPDKACLIFGTQEGDGYRLSMIDHTNKQQDAQYWAQDFLQVAPVANNYHCTSELMSMCRQFVTKALPDQTEVTKGQQIELMHRSLDYFKENEQFHLDGFTQQVLETPEMTAQFHEFKDLYEKNRQVQLEDNFDIHHSAVQKQGKVFKSVLKLDKNFHIYIHGRRDLIERGYDEQSGKHFYKIYFEDES